MFPIVAASGEPAGMFLYPTSPGLQLGAGVVPTEPHPPAGPPASKTTSTPCVQPSLYALLIAIRGMRRQRNCSMAFAGVRRFFRALRMNRDALDKGRAVIHGSLMAISAQPLEMA